MTTFWRMPCKPDSGCKTAGDFVQYRYGWLMAMGDHWRIAKERRGKFRRVTRWFMKHDKKLRPNPNKKRDAARWRKLGYGD